MPFSPSTLPTTRRRALAGLAAAAAWPLPLQAQGRVPRVGILRNGQAVPARDLELARELARLGYVEGRNIAFEMRAAAGDLSQLPRLARELAALRPDVIVASATPAAHALLEATSDIPIVMTAVGDPVALGLTGSMSRPTRNLTGFTISSLSLAAKRLELLHSIVPTLRRVAYLWVPDNPMASLYESNVRKAADVLGIEQVSLALRSETDIPAVFVRAEQADVTGVLVENDPLTLRFSGLIVSECLVRNLPCMHSWPVEVRNGALVSYGPADVENVSRAAFYVDLILKGAKVADLPFEEPTQIKLVANLRTARSIGVRFPDALLARADEVLE